MYVYLVCVRMYVGGGDGDGDGDVCVRPWMQRYKNMEAMAGAIAQLRELRPALHEFEIVSLGNLLPDTAEEAKTMLPSLEKGFEGLRNSGVPDEALDALLGDLKSYQKFDTK